MMFLNSFSFIFTNIQMQSKLAGRLSLTLIYFNDLNKAKLREKILKNEEIKKQKKKLIN
jgi:hypothetical protein